MSPPSDEVEQTIQMLQSAPVDRFLKAVESLEQQPDLDEVKEIRRQIRTRLAEIRPPRRMNLMRVFCYPFEEMLQNSAETDGSRIPRACIAALWAIVEQRLKPGWLRTSQAEVSKLNSDDRSAAVKTGTELWAMAGEILEAETVAARAGKTKFPVLEDPVMLARAETMGAACQAAPALEALREEFPQRPLPGLMLGDRELLHDQLKRIGLEGKTDLRNVIHVVAHWTRNPAEVFDLCADLDLGLPSPLGRAVFAQREQLIVSSLMEQAETLRAELAQAAPTLADTVDRIQSAAESLRSIDALTSREGGSADARVKAVQKELCAIVEKNLLPEVDQAIRVAWRDPAQAQDPATHHDAIAAAEAAARAIRRCSRFARALGADRRVAQQVSSALADISAKVDQTISAAQPHGEARRVLANATRMVEILDGPERAFDFFRERRAKASR